MFMTLGLLVSPSRVRRGGRREPAGGGGADVRGPAAGRVRVHAGHRPELPRVDAGGLGRPARRGADRAGHLPRDRRRRRGRHVLQHRVLRGAGLDADPGRDPGPAGQGPGPDRRRARRAPAPARGGHHPAPGRRGAGVPGRTERRHRRAAREPARAARARRWSAWWCATTRPCCPAGRPRSRPATGCTSWSAAPCAARSRSCSSAGARARSGSPTQVPSARSGRSPIFTVKPWTEVMGDPGAPEAVEDVRRDPACCARGATTRARWCCWTTAGWP